MDAVYCIEAHPEINRVKQGSDINQPAMAGELFHFMFDGNRAPYKCTSEVSVECPAITIFYIYFQLVMIVSITFCATDSGNYYLNPALSFSHCFF